MSKHNASITTVEKNEMIAFIENFNAMRAAGLDPQRDRQQFEDRLYLEPTTAQKFLTLVDDNRRKVERLATAWREERGYTGRGGVVVVFNGEVCGWMDKLRDAHKWEPGCIAVDEHGQQWQSVGGNAYDGADTWQQVMGKGHPHS